MRFDSLPVSSRTLEALLTAKLVIATEIQGKGGHMQAVIAEKSIGY